MTKDVGIRFTNSQFSVPPEISQSKSDMVISQIGTRSFPTICEPAVAFILKFRKDIFFIPAGGMANSPLLIEKGMMTSIMKLENFTFSMFTPCMEFLE